LVINGLNSISSGTILPLGFRTGESNNFQIKATQFNNFDSDTHIILKDNQLGIVHDLTDGSAYNFSSEIDTTLSRFSVVFKSGSIATEMKNTAGNDETTILSVYKNANGQITVNCTTGIIGQGSVSVYNAVGQKLVNQKMTGNTTVLNNTFTSGVYFVSVVTNGKTTTRKIVIN